MDEDEQGRVWWSQPVVPGMIGAYELCRRTARPGQEAPDRLRVSPYGFRGGVCVEGPDKDEVVAEAARQAASFR